MQIKNLIKYRREHTKVNMQGWEFRRRKRAVGMIRERGRQKLNGGWMRGSNCIVEWERKIDERKEIKFEKDEI